MTGKNNIRPAGVALAAAARQAALAGQATARVHPFSNDVAGGGPVGPGTALTPVFIQVIAQNSTNKTIRAFNGTVEIRLNEPLFPDQGTTTAFSGGIPDSHSVNFSSGGSFILLATNSAGAESGVSATFVSSNPLPQIGSISPSLRTAGDTGLSLTIYGTGLSPASPARLNG